MTLMMDRGSDNFSCGHALLYMREVRLNISIFWDPSRDAWRSVLEAVRLAVRQSFMMLLMFYPNLPDGPDATVMRFVQVQAAARGLFNIHTWRSCSLLEECS